MRKHAFSKDRPSNPDDIVMVARDPSIVGIPTPILRASSISSNAKVAYAAIEQINELTEQREDFSDRDLAEWVGMTDQVFQGALDELSKEGFIEVADKEDDADSMQIRLNRQHPIFIEGYIVKAHPKE